jgi:hypothetical protein
MMMKAQQIIQLEFENQRNRQENQRWADEAAAQGQPKSRQTTNQADGQRTGGLLDGRSWNLAVQDHKIAFLRGFMEAGVL